MTTLALYARLIRMTDDVQVASTTSLVKGQIERGIDRPGKRSISVPLSDVGAGTDDASGFANALLAAVGGPGLSGSPVPTLCQGSFDGGATVDFQFMVETVTPDLSSGTLLLTASGADSGSLYGGIGPDRWPARAIALADIVGGNNGAIKPQSTDAYGISTDGTIPGLRGILKTQPGQEQGAVPGQPMWDSAASARVAVTGVVATLAPGLESVLAFIATNLDSAEDTILRIVTTLVKILGGVVFAADDQPQGSRGHAVWCDAEKNLSGDIVGVVCDGTPGTSGSPTAAGADGYSNDATNHPTGIPRALVIGNVGGHPQGVPFTFDGTATAPLDPTHEPATARLDTTQTALVQDLTPVFSEIRVRGGTNDAGLAPGEQITALITLHNTPVENAGGGEHPPYVSWQDVLPIVGTNLSDVSGGLYFYAGDNRLRRIPSWTLSVPVSALEVDSAHGTIFAATSQGVFSHATANLATSVELWTRVGGLPFAVTRLQGLVLPTESTPFYLYALVTGVGPAQDGIYQWDQTTPTSEGDLVGRAAWSRLSSGEKLISFCAVSDHEIFYLTPADQQAALHYYDAANPTTPHTPWAFPEGVQGVRLDRVVTAAGGGQDSVWVTTSGGSQPGYYLLYSAGWTSLSLQPIDKTPGTAGSALDVAVGAATGTIVEPQINRVTALGYGINGVTIAVMLCSQAGVYYMAGSIPADGGVGWSAQANGLSGLGGLAVTHLVAGQPTHVPSPYDPTAYVAASRLYASSGQAFFMSASDARYWGDLLKEPVTLAPYFYALAQGVLGDLPGYGVQTIGPMATSPLGAASSTHVQVANCLPVGWYWRRRWNPRYEPYYALVPGAVPFPQVYEDQVTEATAGTSTSPEQASADLAAFFIVLAGEHNRQEPALTLHAAFTEQQSGLRYLWPSHHVSVKQQGSIKMLSADGHSLITTTYLDLSGSETLYVLSHSISWQDGVVSTITEVAPSVRGTPLSGSDLGAALIRGQKVHAVKALRHIR